MVPGNISIYHLVLSQKLIMGIYVEDETVEEKNEYPPKNFNLFSVLQEAKATK